MFISTVSRSDQWEGYTLILPSISVGNVGQLTTDLLISTLSCNSVGYLHDESIIPLCGNDAYGNTGVAQGSLVTSTEVYKCKEKQLIIVQQRSPLVKGKQKDFRKKLLTWVKECKFEKVILLCSTYSHERIDSQISGSPFRYLATPSLTPNIPADLQWQQLEKRENTWGGEKETVPESTPEETRGIYVPGGGIAKKLFEDCCREQVALATLMVFCSEGDNIPDALTLVTHLNQWLKLVQEPTGEGNRTSPWRIPRSWDLLYGSAVESSIY